MKRSVAMTMVVTMGLPVAAVTQKSQSEIDKMRFGATKLEQADRSPRPNAATLTRATSTPRVLC